MTASSATARGFGASTHYARTRRRLPEADDLAAGLLIDHLPLRSLVNAQAMIYVVCGAVALWLFAGRRMAGSVS